VVTEQADEGDAVARSIVEGAGRELALGVATVAGKLGLADTAMEVSWSGSVFSAGDVIIVPFAEAVRKRCPTARVKPPVMPAVGGGVRIACERLGWDYGPMQETLIRDLR